MICSLQKILAPHLRGLDYDTIELAEEAIGNEVDVTHLIAAVRAVEGTKISL